MSAFYRPIGFPVIGIGPALATFGLGASNTRQMPTCQPAPMLRGELLPPTIIFGALIPGDGGPGVSSSALLGERSAWE